MGLLICVRQSAIYVAHTIDFAVAVRHSPIITDRVRVTMSFEKPAVSHTDDDSVPASNLFISLTVAYKRPRKGGHGYG